MNRRVGLVLVPVMDVRIMRVAMAQLLVTMAVAVRLTRWIVRPMLMLVVLIVAVEVRVLHAFVPMLMLVTFRQMQPNARPHEHRGY